MPNIREAKAALEAARTEAVAAVKYEIKQALQDAFNDPSVENVVFGVSTDPYNDENSGQGVFGPLVNSLSDGETFERDDEYELFYNSYGSPDPGAANLSRVLQEAGWELAGEALGVSYWPGEGHGQTAAFVALRRDGGGYSFESVEIYN